MQIFKKISLFCFTVLFLLSSVTPITFAASDSFSLSDINSILGQLGIFNTAGTQTVTFDAGAMTDKVLESLGLDKTSVHKITKQVNSSPYKVDAPQVNLTFAPTTPTPGKELTAVAEANFFRSKPSGLYFTWFLKRKSCIDDPKSCDYNKDGRTNIEDYKIEAMRTLASGKFEWQKTLGQDDPNCKSTYPPDHCTLPNQYAGGGQNDSDSDGYTAVIGGDAEKGKESHCFVRDIKLGEEVEMLACEHLFPDVSSYPGLSNEVVGDGHFGKKEEEFWRTDPNANDTAGNGIMDEATVAGQGRMTFKWVYSPGDEIGVAVEGAATISTENYNSSYKIMWAITNNPDVFEKMGDPTGAIPTKDDINNALEDAFIKPTVGTDFKKITNNMSTNNASPQYDSSPGGQKSDTITIQSNSTNSEYTKFTNYKWSLEVASSASASVWQSLSQTELGEDVQLEGLGLSELKLSLKNISQEVLKAKGIPENAKAFYIRATLRTTENSSEGIKKEGLETMIITVQTSQGEILIHNGVVNTTGALTQGKERCNEGAKKFVCPVTVDEIISASISKNQYDPDDYIFSWSFDGERIVNQPNDRENIIYFPITGTNGDKSTLKVDIVKKTSSEKISFVRSFSIADASTAMISSDQTTLAPVLMGHFTDPDNDSTWADYSKDYFLALPDSVVQINAEQNSAIPGETVWLVDGEEIANVDASTGTAFLSNNGQTLNLPVKKDLGETYSVTSITSREQDEATKKVLYEKWKISRGSLSEGDVEKTITVLVSNNINGTISPIEARKKNSSKILASLFAGLPSYVIFLFRIIVTFALILFLSSLALNFSPAREKS